MIKIAGIFTMMLLFTPAVFAQEDFYAAEEKARQAHDLGMSDFIYEHESTKALYYQNLQIIGLLKEIRDEMRAFNTRAAKEEKA